MVDHARDAVWRGFLVRRATQSRDIRGPGWSGFGECAQEFLRDLDMTTIRQQGLERRLDGLTDRLVARWDGIAGETGSNAWGIARKTINSFLIDSVYHTQFMDVYEEGLAEFLELALDRTVAAGLLRALRPGNHWPRGQGVSFPGVAHLDAEAHSAWQALGEQVARTMGMTRVELGIALADGHEIEVEDEGREDAALAVELVRSV